jgi:xanthine dehydrogenase accessory factor
MNNSVLQRAHELIAQGVPFALATVVRRERPTSGQPGDKAIITPAGEFVGWVGGSCAQPTVLQEAQKALADGEPRLVVLTPNLDAEVREGIELYRMTCYSGGTMEIYIEPYLPEPQLLICGASPAAEALVKIGKAVGLQIFLIDPSATAENFPDADVILPQIMAGKFLDTRERYAVVATMGNWDEEAIKDILALSPAYLGLVASKKRFQEIVSRLSGEGVSHEQLALVTCPAGLEISARTLPEVALSIMAEIVLLRRGRAETGAAASGPAQVVLPAMAEDPVCHMRVDPQTARHRVDFEGLTYYFCNASCKTSFEKDPRKYLAQEVRA